MATLRDYFDTDFRNDLAVQRSASLGFSDGAFELDVVARLHYDFGSNAKYVSYFVPQTDRLFDVCVHLLSNLDMAFSLSNGVQVGFGFVGEDKAADSDLRFAGRVFIYHDYTLSSEQASMLCRIASERNVALRLRGPTYASKRSATEKPMAFICHDSRDKDEVARPLAFELARLMCPVWFDEFSLKVGDSLREKIEKGLKECEKCVIILSPLFFANEGWTKVEFTSIFTRELVERKCVMLPVWHNVERKEVFDYCPGLADKVGVPWKLGKEEVARRLRNAMQ